MYVICSICWFILHTFGNWLLELKKNCIVELKVYSKMVADHYKDWLA